MHIGQSIKELRKEKGIKQGALAKAVKISQTSMSLIECGITYPSEKVMDGVSKALCIPKPIIHFLTMKREDVPESKQELFDILFPVIKSLSLQIVKMKE